MSFAETLRSLRQSKKLSRQGLADATGISVHSIASYEKGRREPNSKALTALERFFNVSGEYLRGESKDRQGTYQWEDPEIMQAVRESLPKQLSDLNDILKNCSAEEQKQVFNILVQLRLVLLLEDVGKRQTALSMIHDVAVAVERLTSDRPQSASTDKPTTSQDDCL